MTDIADILSNIDPEDLLCELGVDYKNTTGSSGAQLNIRTCPRCSGSDWKVYLNADTGLGNCFHGSCVGEPGFNLFTFTRLYLAENNKGVVDFLKKYSETAYGRPTAARREPEERRHEFDLPESVDLPYENKLPGYLLKRGFNGEVCRIYNWKYSKDGVFDYVDYEGRARAQSYKSRIIIPIFDLEGNLVTFQGRDITGKAEPKYLFPPGLPGTGRYLYGGNNAWGFTRLVLCEGVFDVAATNIALKGSDQIAVGTFGKSLSGGSASGNDQMGELHRLKAKGLREVTIMWDGERKAIEDAARAALRVKAIGFKTRLAVLPEGKDPNEVSTEVVLETLGNAIKVSTTSMARVSAKLAAGISCR